MGAPKKPLTGNPNQHDPSLFHESISGSCLCGAINVTIHDDLFSTPRGHLCHCSNCRKIAGSFTSANLLIEREKVKVTDEKGAMRKYDDYATASGNVVERYFCGTCGCPIMSKPAVFPTKCVMKMGLFPRIPKPQFETFAEHRHDWQGTHEGLEQYATLITGKKLGE